MCTQPVHPAGAYFFKGSRKLLKSSTATASSSLGLQAPWIRALPGLVAGGAMEQHSLLYFVANAIIQTDTQPAVRVQLSSLLLQAYLG